MHNLFGNLLAEIDRQLCVYSTTHAQPASVRLNADYGEGSQGRSYGQMLLELKTDLLGSYTQASHSSKLLKC